MQKQYRSIDIYAPANFNYTAVVEIKRDYARGGAPVFFGLPFCALHDDDICEAAESALAYWLPQIPRLKESQTRVVKIFPSYPSPSARKHYHRVLQNLV